MDAINDNNFDKDTDGVEAPTIGGNQGQVCHTGDAKPHRYAVYIMHTLHSYACSLYYAYAELAHMQSVVCIQCTCMHNLECWYMDSIITAVTTHSLYIGGGLPPIPEKLIRHIQDVHFINMAKLLPDNLEATNSTDDDHTMNNKHEQQDVTQIMDRIQCFSTYISRSCILCQAWSCRRPNI